MKFNNKDYCMRKFLVLLFIFNMISLFPHAKADALNDQQQEVLVLREEVKNLQNEIKKQNKTINSLRVAISRQNENNDHFTQQIEKNIESIEYLSADLEEKIHQTNYSISDGIAKVDKGVYKNKLIVIALTSALFLIVLVLYLLLKKRMSKTHADVEAQIKSTKIVLEEESLKLDNKLIEVLETQLKIQEEETKIKSSKSLLETDHSLALKVADEIVRMQKNLSRFDNEHMKGIKPIEKGIERIQANFAANGYEVINLLNGEFDERMNVDVINFLQDDNLKEGKRIITKIIKPQVNYQGILIQRAQIEVSQN